MLKLTQLKVLAVCADIFPERLGGAEGHFVEVLKRIAPKIEKADVLVGQSRQIKKEFSAFANVRFVAVWYPRVANLFGVFYVLFALPKALILALTNRYDLIWAKQEFPQAQVGAIVKLLTGLPLYVTCQNPLLHREELVLQGWAEGIRSVVMAIGDLFVKFALGRANVVAAVSKYSAVHAKKMGGKKVVVIPNGVDRRRVKSQKVKVKNKGQKLKIITTSALIPRNGIDVLLLACAALPRKIDWELKIAGDGPERGKLKGIVRELDLGRRVKFLGRVPHDLVFALLSSADLFVRPSRAEGFGASFIEAMAAGILAVGTPVGGIGDFIKDGKTGFLVPVDDPEALGRKIVYLHSHSKVARGVARKGQELVFKNYSWDKIAARVYKVWTRL